MPSSKTISPDKVVIANRSGMTSKYGSSGVADIYAALQTMIAADQVRGLLTVVVDIDDAVQLLPFATAPIINGADQPGAKRVVDAIDTAIAPDYFLLLDGPDVIPQIKLLPVAGLNDGDTDIPSDLPYASAAPFSYSPNDYLAVTRVVGRLPMPVGSTDAVGFVKLIETCSSHVPQPASAYNTYFAISTDTWKTSTQLNLSALFGSHAGLSVSPVAGHSVIDASLGAMTHIINCHGATNDPRFYGQQAKSFPIAMHSAQVAPFVMKGTIVAAECCFGAELYDPSLAAAGVAPMSVMYLLGGAAAYVGSTNIAYGPFNTNGQADLMAQFFIDAVLKGASTGRAMLQARQRFVSSQKMADPTNMKTLAQFVLYGDPSIVCVNALPPVGAAVAVGQAVEEVLTTAKTIFEKIIDRDDERSGRKARRIGLKGIGETLASSATHIGEVVQASSIVRKRIQEIADARGFGDIELFKVGGGRAFRQAAKAIRGNQQVAVASQTETHYDERSGTKHLVTRILVAQVLGDGIVAVNETVSR